MGLQLSRILDRGKTERLATVRFAHIRYFTNYAGSEDPDKAVRLLNNYSGYVITNIEAEGGRITTLIGDTVNTASRIESETKNVGTEILLSAATYAFLEPALQQEFAIDPQPLNANVKGKRELLQNYAVQNDTISAGR